MHSTPSPWPFRYETCCVNSTAEKIIAMTDRALDITWATFRRHVHWTEVQSVFPDYSYREGEQTFMHIKNDWHVRFCRSVYDGQPCYYIVHSAIEYIFINSSHQEEVHVARPRHAAPAFV